jgi:small-conductance mechanosensitive channel
MTQTFWTTYGPALIALAGAVVAGMVADQLLFRALRSRFARTQWAPGVALATAIHGLPTITGVLIGLMLAGRRLTLPGDWSDTLAGAWKVIFILVGTAFAARILGRLVRALTESEGSRLPTSSIFANLARGLVWIIGVLLVLSAVGVSITPMVTALGVGGLAVGLALQSTLENVFSGIQVLLSRQIEPGDFIQLETGQQGFVADVTWRNTTIKLLSNDLVIVPNSTIGKSLITNFTSDSEQHILWVPLSVDYASDLDRVEDVSLGVAREIQSTVESAVAEHEPVLRFTEFASSGIALQVSLRADSFSNRFAVRHEFIKALKLAYEAEGIVIPYPQHTVHLAAETTGPGHGHSNNAQNA